MRGLLLALLLPVLISGTALAQPISEPAHTNLILTIQASPQLAPGERGDLRLELHNPYDWAMENVSLFGEIYAFLHRAEHTEIAGLPNPPSLGADGSSSTRVEFGSLPEADRRPATIPVGTSAQTPGGTVFTQGAYLLRFRLDFDYLGGLHAVMVSPGFYTAEEWTFATREPSPQEQVDYRYVGWANYSSLGLVLGLPSIDGILPDSGFGVKEPLPLWPFQLLAVGAGFAIAGSGYYVWRGRRTGGKS
ncbi:MAG: hypothetical protein LN410_00905 [Candidatus Thermoplasmatota archaeon]|nr:hypothetical protein [Candidatus Thermoplasmatota archaeon]